MLVRVWTLPDASAALQRDPRPVPDAPVKAARLLVAVVLVAVGVGGLAGAGTLLAGPTPADGPLSLTE